MTTPTLRLEVLSTKKFLVFGSLLLHQEPPRQNAINVPSIVVNNNGTNNSMEKTRTSKNRLSKQDEFEEVEEDPPSGGGDGTSDVDKADNWDRKNNDKDVQKNNDKSGSKTDSSSSSSSSSTKRSHPKVKLQRSHAVDDNTLSVTSATNTLITQSKGSPNKQHKLGKQGSSQGSFEGSSPCLSRESSTEQYTDSTGIDLHQFIVDTLHRNQKDRVLLLKIEHELNSFVKDNKHQYHKFAQMSSYQRMVVHRVAAYFGMEHNVDQPGTAVIVNKTKNTRLPDKRFRDLIRDELVPDEPKRSILKRDSSSFEEGKDLKSPERQLSSESRRSKSFEEREEEYEKARARIFNQDSSSSQEGPVDSPIRSHESTHNSSRRSSQEDLRWATDPRPWSSTDSDSSNRPTKPVITKTSASTESDASTSSRPSRGILAKADSDGSRELMLHLPRSRPASVPKASSFGGISVLVRGDSITSTRSATPRLTKAESFTSSSTSCTSSRSHRLSPSRANGKASSDSSTAMAAAATPGASSLSPVSNSPGLAPVPQVAQVNPTAVAPSLSNSCHPPPPPPPPPMQSQPTLVRTNSTENSSQQQQVWPSASSGLPSDSSGPPSFVQGQPVMWAVSNMESVPPGSILINPQTGQPYLNPDGSLYRHAPTTSVPVMPPSAPPSSAAQQQQPLGGQPPVVAQQPPPPLPSQLPVAPLQHQVQVPVPPAPVPVQPQQQQQPPAPPPPQLVLYTQLLSQPQAHHPEQRHFTLENNSGMGDLSGHLTSLSFSPHPLPTDSGASGDGSQVMQQATSSAQLNQQRFIMSSLPPAGLVAATTQGNVAQMPVYFVPPPPSVPSAQPLRVMYPMSYVSSQQQQQSHHHQSAVALVPSQQAAQQQQHAQVAMHVDGGHHHHHPHHHHPHHPHHHPAASPVQQVPGQYVQSYPMVGYSPQLPPNHQAAASGDTYSVSPYYHQMTTTHAAPSSVPNYSYTAPTSLSVPTVTNGSCVSSASQSPYGMPQMYGPPMPTAVVPSPSPFSPHTQQVSYRPQTPPAQNHHQQQQQTTLTLNSPYMGYTVFPPSTQVPPATPTTPTQSALFPNAFSSQPVLTAAFPMFRPGGGMQLMTVRSSTPPPMPPAPSPHHGLLQTPYSTGPLLTKSYSLPADHRFGKSTAELYLTDAGSLAGNHCQDAKSLTSAVLSSLSNSTGNVRPAASLYGRGPIPLMQAGDMRILGSPLQPQMSAPGLRTSLVLPQPRGMMHHHRYQNPGMATNAGRPLKVRKQRGSKAGSGGGSKAESTTVTPQASVDLPDSSWGHVLEVQSLPEGLKRSEAERYLEEVTTFGGRLHFVCDGAPGGNGGGDCVVSGGGKSAQVLVIFQSDTEAQSALVNIKTSKFELRLASSSSQLEQEPPPQLEPRSS